MNEQPRPILNSPPPMGAHARENYEILIARFSQALQVKCPTCNIEPGHACIDSGYAGAGVHSTRIARAHRPPDRVLTWPSVVLDKEEPTETLRGDDRIIEQQ